MSKARVIPGQQAYGMPYGGYPIYRQESNTTQAPTTVGALSRQSTYTYEELTPFELTMALQGTEKNVDSIFFNGHAYNLMKIARDGNDVANCIRFPFEYINAVYLVNKNTSFPLLGVFVVTGTADTLIKMYLFNDGRVSISLRAYGSIKENSNLQAMRSEMMTEDTMEMLTGRWEMYRNKTEFTNQMIYRGAGISSFVMDIDIPEFKLRKPVPMKNTLFYGNLLGYGSGPLPTPVKTGPTDEELALETKLRKALNTVDALQAEVDSLKRTISLAADSYEKTIAEIKTLL